MGLFGRSRELSFADTRLNVEWFSAWFDRVCDGTGQPRSQEVIGDYVAKLRMVLMHESESAVTSSCPAWSARLLQDFYTTDEATPWKLTSAIVGMPSSDPHWATSMEDFLEARLNRFGDILIDPSVAQ
jgi:hypothetical protein